MKSSAAVASGDRWGFVPAENGEESQRVGLDWARVPNRKMEELMSDFYETPNQPREVLVAGYLTYWLAREKDGDSVEESYAAASEAILGLLTHLDLGAARLIARDIIEWSQSPEGMQFAEGISEEEREIAEHRYFAWADGMDFCDVTQAATGDVPSGLADNQEARISVTATEDTLDVGGQQ